MSKHLHMHGAGTAAFPVDEVLVRLEEHFGTDKRWHVRGTVLDLEYLADVYRRVESGRVVGGAADETTMRREDRALQILRKNGFIKYTGRKSGWKTTAATTAAERE